MHRLQICSVNQNHSSRNFGTAGTEYNSIETKTKELMYNSAPWIARNAKILTRAPEANWKATNHNKHHPGYRPHTAARKTCMPREKTEKGHALVASTIMEQFLLPW